MLGTTNARKPAHGHGELADRSPRDNSSKSRSFPEIQALRALAVLAVVIYHFWPGVDSGGYVGVDVFFVISGFLITSHLLRELVATGRLRLASFYARRARRLLPAALLVIGFAGIGTLLLLPQRVWGQVMSELLASALYVQNWVLAGNSVDYLAQNTNILSPVQHYWSLSVEEQFYLVWPLLLLIGWWIAAKTRDTPNEQRGRKILFLGLGAVFVISLIASIVATIQNPAPAYFATDVRAWEFAAGGLVAVFYKRSRRLPGLRAVVSWLGLAAIILAMFNFTAVTPFPGYTALLPVAGTVAIILGGNPDARWSPRYLIVAPPVQFLGDISYSLYLWHWPLLILGTALLEQHAGPVGHIAILAVAVLLSVLMKRFVEDPARNGKFLKSRKPRVTLIGAVAAMALVAIFTLVTSSIVGQTLASEQQQGKSAVAAGDPCLGAGSLTTKGCSARPGLLIPGVEVAPRDDVNTPACWSTNGVSALKECSSGPTSGAALRVALIGDSHSNQYLATLKQLATEYRWHFDVYGKTGCIWTAADQVNSPDWVSNCDTWKAELNRHLASVKPYDVIITSSLATSPIKAVTGESLQQTTVEGFVSVWKPVVARGTQIVAIRDNPEPRAGYLDCIDAHTSDPGTECARGETQALHFFDGQPQAVTKVPGAHLLDLTKYFCQNQICPPVIGNVIVYRDATHLTSSYTRTLAPMVRVGILDLTGLKESQ